MAEMVPSCGQGFPFSGFRAYEGGLALADKPPVAPERSRKLQLRGFYRGAEPR